MTNQNSYPRIFLIRHGKPLVSRAGFFSHRSAAQFILDYDATDVEEFDRILADVDFANLKHVHCSTLQRAKGTARKLFGSEITLKEDAVFREFERKIIKLPMLKMPIRFWLILSRLLWVFGFNKSGIESFTDARNRAKAGANLLAAEAKKEGVAVLVAHGFLNRFLVRSLKRSGWQLAKKADYGFVGVTELAFVTSPQTPLQMRGEK